MLLSARFPLAAALAAVLLLGPTRAALLALVLSFAALASWVALRIFLHAPKREDTIAFFHPNAAGGGGGERVLWCAVQALQRRLPEAKIAIMCDGKLSARSLRRCAKETFGVDLDRDVDVVVPLSDVSRLDPKRHPRLTLLSQSLAGGLLALKGIRECGRGARLAGGTPALFVDTSGWPLSFLVAKAAGCDVAAYVHYPIVSSDMLARVRNESKGEGEGGEEESGGGGRGSEEGEKEKKKSSGSGSGAFAVAGGSNNSSSSSSSSSPVVVFGKLRSAAKTAYYHLVASLYGALGGLFCDVTVANSSWTAGHLEALWWRRKWRRRTRLPPSKGEEGSKAEDSPSSPPPSKRRFSSSVVVYPPCGASSLGALPLERAPLPEEYFERVKKKKEARGGGGGGGEAGKLLIALAQFRPEKNQAALLRAFALARSRAAREEEEEGGKKSSSSSSSTPSPSPSRRHPVLSSRLALVGGVRDAADAARVEELRALAAELGLVVEKKEEKKEKKEKKGKGKGSKDGDESENVDDDSENDDDDDDDAVVFVTNAPRESLRRLLSSATGGLHAMVDEHFGICVVEYMSAGVVPIAHGSAGPKMDIVVDEEDDDEEGEDGGDGGDGDGDDEGRRRRRRRKASSASASPPPRRRSVPTGFLCSSEEEYADAIARLLLLSAEGGGGGGGAAAAATKGQRRKTATTTTTSTTTNNPSPPSPLSSPHYSALDMAAAARRRALRLFDDSAFDEGFVGALEPLLSRVERGASEESKRKKEKQKSK